MNFLKSNFLKMMDFHISNWVVYIICWNTENMFQLVPIETIEIVIFFLFVNSLLSLQWSQWFWNFHRFIAVKKKCSELASIIQMFRYYFNFVEIILANWLKMGITCVSAAKTLCKNVQPQLSSFSKFYIFSPHESIFL